MSNEFGRLVTKQDEMMFAMIVEQRKTNQLLEALIASQEKVQVIAPLEAIQEIKTPEPKAEPEVDPTPAPVTKGKGKPKE